ncbi:Frag1/DRAM/Sfk1 family protein NDAI_0C00610 [Naumovozyma dairenensis CBS 421]|uniref:CWH43-like N-terminal domain-containing protein n=1 Tax=Naumovozyma dairenensis (strain ATCC 10597 / BCRC 20456 / CBS 421 / NBRC 0211 / NRRL Y-12639) TaxID=1071378 RepID=G0W7G1_NAUDC|nr:hypothetical protein NDAI_0C00610 [Naumovozyma dairenensis CBS 421]CCD23722.1 hypothetical protein NDAI_0C00610 [Naumovozyma dairenensis CBS 421]
MPNNKYRPGNYFFLLPWIAFIPWYGMLITMLICWAAQGHPIYWFMHSEQFPVYISDIGATNLRPLFISCAGWQGLGYVITVMCEFVQRYGFKNWYGMQPWFTKDERNLIWAALILGAIGELGLLFLSIFSTARYHDAHTAMVVVFCIFMLLSIICLTTQYFIMGRHYALLHPKNYQNRDYNTKTIHELKWWQWDGVVWNKFVISGYAKTVWMVLAIVFAICFGAIDNDSTSASFEWLLAFWFGVIFMIISVDFYLGSRWQFSKYFNKIEDFNGYYKYGKFQQVRKDKHGNGMYDNDLEKQTNEHSQAIIQDTSSGTISSSSAAIAERGNSEFVTASESDNATNERPVVV